MRLGNVSDQPLAAVLLPAELLLDESQGVALLGAAAAELHQLRHERLLVDVDEERIVNRGQRLIGAVGPLEYLGKNGEVPRVFGLEFARSPDVSESLVETLARPQHKRSLPQRPGVAIAALHHVEDRAVRVGIRVSGEELGAQLQKRMVMREALAGLGQVGPRCGAPVRLGQ